MTIKIKNFSKPEVGDKMAVFSGGCKATISNILPDARIPYFEDGS